MRRKMSRARASSSARAGAVGERDGRRGGWSWTRPSRFEDKRRLASAQARADSTRGASACDLPSAPPTPCAPSPWRPASTATPKARAWSPSATPGCWSPPAWTKACRRFLRGRGQGWVTAEYGMLPRATHTRGRREAAAGQAVGPHPGDPAPDRPLPARRDRPEGAGRAADHPRLRRHPGRRRHPHRRDHRRLGGPAAGHPLPAGRGRDRRRPDPRPRRGDLLRRATRTRRCSTSTTRRTATPRPTPTSCSPAPATSSRSRPPARSAASPAPSSKPCSPWPARASAS